MHEPRTPNAHPESVQERAGPPAEADGATAANPLWERIATRPAVATGVGTRLQRQADSSAAAESPVRTAAPYGVIVADDAVVGEGQITRAEFLEHLRIDIAAQSDAKLVRAGKTSKDCPYIPHWLGYYA